MAADDVRGVDWPRHSGASVPDVYQTEDEPQPRQRGAGAGGQRVRAASRGACLVVHQPYVGQRFCRHAGRLASVLRGAGGRCVCIPVARLSRHASARERGAVEAVVVVDGHVQAEHRAHWQPAARC